MKQKKDFIEIAVPTFIILVAVLLLSFAFIPFKNNLLYNDLHPGNFWKWLGFWILMFIVLGIGGFWFRFMREDKIPEISFGFGMAVVGLVAIAIALLVAA
jgi:hypothetical protein